MVKSHGVASGYHITLHRCSLEAAILWIPKSFPFLKGGEGSNPAQDNITFYVQITFVATCKTNPPALFDFPRFSQQEWVVAPLLDLINERNQKFIVNQKKKNRFLFFLGKGKENSVFPNQFTYLSTRAYLQDSCASGTLAYY